jgi:esterase/lipase
MEKEIKIKKFDKKVIYGTFVGSKKKSNKLIVFIHGFTGNQNEHIFFNGAKFFSDRGFDTFRFNLYAGEGKNSRHFEETKISLHGKDINTVVKYFRKKYKSIYVVGHSYGGTSLLFVDQSTVDGFIFWDASYINHKDVTENMKYSKNLNSYILDWGIRIIVGKKFIEELKKFPDCGKLIKNIHKPVLFIGTGKGNINGAKKYYKKANNPKKLVNIKNADHNFNKLIDEERLFKETYNWLIYIKVRP